jgi:hypothetical protein
MSTILPNTGIVKGEHRALEAGQRLISLWLLVEIAIGVGHGLSRHEVHLNLITLLIALQENGRTLARVFSGSFSSRQGSESWRRGKAVDVDPEHGRTVEVLVGVVGTGVDRRLRQGERLSLTSTNRAYPDPPELKPSLNATFYDHED